MEVVKLRETDTSSYSNHWPALASFPDHSQICLAAVEKTWEKAWYQYYVADRKWWTQLEHNVDSVS